MKRRSLLQSIGVTLFAPLASFASISAAPEVDDEDVAFLCGVGAGYRNQFGRGRAWTLVDSAVRASRYEAGISDGEFAARVLSEETARDAELAALRNSSRLVH